MEQLYYGHIASLWAQYLDHASQYKINRTIFYLQIIIHMWKYILKIWTIQNAALHPQTFNQQTVQLLALQVYHLFHQIENDPALQEYKPQSTAKQILQLPI